MAEEEGREEKDSMDREAKGEEGRWFSGQRAVKERHELPFGWVNQEHPSPHQPLVHCETGSHSMPTGLPQEVCGICRCQAVSPLEENGSWE